MAKVAVLILLIFDIILTRHVQGNQLCDSTTSELQVKVTQQRLSFPSNQNISNSLYPCQWRIRADDEDGTIELVMQSVVINDKRNCSSASLTIYDGYDATDFILRQECGNRTKALEVNSSNDYVYVVWTLPENNVNNSFTLWFAALQNDGKTYSFRKSNVAPIVAGVILSILFVGTILAVLICFFRNRKSMLSRSLSTASTTRRHRDSRV